MRNSFEEDSQQIQQTSNPLQLKHNYNNSLSLYQNDLIKMNAIMEKNDVIRKNQSEFPKYNSKVNSSSLRTRNVCLSPPKPAPKQKPPLRIKSF